MISIRRSSERGLTRLNWLDSRHSFSFGDYYDPQNMGFRSLRVINDDRVAPASGFGMHGHRDMEIITYVLSGTLAHSDSTGTGSGLKRGDVQRMSAGSGIRHSEFNDSQQEPAHFLQIWVVPEREGLRPTYEQQHFSDQDRQAKLRLIAAHDGRDRSLTIHQDVDLFATLLAPNERVTHPLRPGRHAWIQVADGAVTVNGHLLQAGDGASVSDESLLEIVGTKGDAEILVFDLA